MRHILIITVALFVVTAWDIALSPLISIAGLKPNLAIIFLVYLSLFQGNYPALFFAFFWGIIADSGSPEALGWSALIYIAIAFVITFIRTHFNWSNLTTQLIIVGIAVIFHDILYFLIFNLGEPGNILFITIRYTLPSALYTTALGTGLYFWLGVRASKTPV